MDRLDERDFGVVDLDALESFEFLVDCKRLVEGVVACLENALVPATRGAEEEIKHGVERREEKDGEEEKVFRVACREQKLLPRRILLLADTVTRIPRKRGVRTKNETRNETKNQKSDGFTRIIIVKTPVQFLDFLCFSFFCPDEGNDFRLCCLVIPSGLQKGEIRKE